MSSYPEVGFVIETGNTNRSEPDKDNVCLMVLTEADNLPLLPPGQVEIVYSIKQAESLGLNSAYDQSQSRYYYHHVKEFFLENPNGELHLVAFINTEIAVILGDSSTPGLLEPIIVADQGNIKQIAILSGDNDPDFLDNVIIADDLVEVAQAFVERLASNNYIIDNVLLEGFGFSYTPSAAPDLRAKGSRNVAVVIGGDRAAATASNDYNGYAAIGALLGCSTRKQIHESFAWYKDDNSLLDVVNGRFLSIKIHTDLTQPDPYLTDPAAIKSLHNKGYIFPRKIPNRSGVFWNQSNNCISSSDDFNNVESVQVLNKAIRLTAQNLSPRINESFDITSAGRLTPQAKETIAASLLKFLQNNFNQHVSKITTIIIDPAKDGNNNSYPSLTQDPTLRAVVGYRPKGKTEQVLFFVGVRA